MIAHTGSVRGMFRQPWLASTVAGVVVLALASGADAQALDGWGTDGGPANPTLTSQSTFGVTLGNFALQSTIAQGGFWGPSTGNLIAQGHRADLQRATTISFDLTLLSSQINGGSGNFTGFAQSNELAYEVFAPSGTPSLPNGINLFVQRNFATGNGTDSLNQNGGWNGMDGTRTIKFDLTQFMGTDPTTGTMKTLSLIHI